MTSKKASSKRRVNQTRAEYKFDYATSRPNRFATRMQSTVAVVLDSDVASVFRTSASVNRELRSALKKRVAAKTKTG